MEILKYYAQAKLANIFRVYHTLVIRYTLSLIRL